MVTDIERALRTARLAVETAAEALDAALDMYKKSVEEPLQAPSGNAGDYSCMHSNLQNAAVMGGDPGRKLCSSCQSFISGDGVVTPV